MAGGVQEAMRQDNFMTLELPIAEARLKTPGRLMRRGGMQQNLAQQSRWLLLAVALGLMAVVRRGGDVRTGSLWLLGFAVLAFMLSFALRDVAGNVRRRLTEDQIVKEVRTFLQAQPPMAAQAAGLSAREDDGEPALTPSGTSDFVALDSAASGQQQDGELVVFDAIAPRAAVAFRTDFHAVLQPVMLQAA